MVDPRKYPRPVGPLVTPQEPTHPQSQTFYGQYVTLRPIVPSDADALFPLITGDENAYLFDYLPYGPFSPDDKPAFQSLVNKQIVSKDPLYWAIVVKPFPAQSSSTSSTEDQESRDEGKVLGWCSLLNITPAHRVVEVGSLLFSGPLQRTAAATEAMFLLAKYVFEGLGYRRLEWKCNDLNAPSKRAAERLGFRFEGVFKKHMIIKGRTRDTAWFSIVDDEWEGGVRKALEKWLERGNFGDKGEQRRKLEDVRRDIVGQ